MKMDSVLVITKPELIANKLAILCKHDCVMYVSNGDDNDEVVRTKLLEINPTTRTLIFYLDAKASFTKHFLECTNLSFNSDYRGVKVVFNTQALQVTHFGSVRAFLVPFPDSLAWLEFRGFHRVTLPQEKPSYCLLPWFGNVEVQIKLIDISLTGFALLNERSALSALFTEGKQFLNCRVSLANSVDVVVSFEIQYKEVLTEKNARSLKELGCRFKRIEDSIKKRFIFKFTYDFYLKIERIGCKFTRIAPAFENHIQAYILQIERDKLLSAAKA
jgi:c-di-GMP-binding flagellar brake protein YcgR